MLASRDERPLVEVLLPLEWNVEWWILAFAWDGDASRAIEDGVDLRVLPELVYRDEGVAEGGHASNVLDDDAAPYPEVIACECG